MMHKIAKIDILNKKYLKCIREIYDKYKMNKIRDE